MAEVAGFRPTDEERRIIARTRASLGFKSDSEAIRYLLRQGAAQMGALRDDPVFRFRLGRKKRDRSLTADEIDAAVYGDVRG